jgi:VanZ family protein
VPDKSVEKIKRREQLMLYAPLLIWIGVILLLGSSQGSMTRTSLIIRPILEFLFPAAPEETLQFYHGIIRKCAHLAEYAVLGFLACRAFAGSAKNSLRKYMYLMAIGVVATVAISDETIQSFNPHRTASPLDSLLDVTGGIVGAFIYFIGSRRRGSSSLTE